MEFNCRESHYVGEENTLFYIDCGIDVSQATLAEVFLKRPDGTSLKKIAAPTVLNGSSDWIFFRIEESDFNQAGKYTGQAFVTLSAWSGWGKPFYINVEFPLSSSSSSSSTPA